MHPSMQFQLSESEQALLPSAGDVEDYQHHGWYLSQKLLTDEELEQLGQASERYYAQGPDRELPHRPSKLAHWTPGDGDVQRHNDYIAYQSQVIGRILRKPLIAAVAARLARARSIHLFQSTLIYKPAIADEPSNIVPWHFDKHYWATSSSADMLTAFIPFHDCFDENGTLVVIDGSNRWEELPHDSSVHLHFAQRDPSELEEVLQRNARHNNAAVKKVPMKIKAGHMSFHHCRVYHGSGANEAVTPRRAISLHLQPGDNRWVESYNADGVLQTYNHDELVVKGPAGAPDYLDPEFCPKLWEQ